MLHPETIPMRIERDMATTAGTVWNDISRDIEVIIYRHLSLRHRL